MSWRDEMYSDSERALQNEAKRLRMVIRELKDENKNLKTKYERMSEIATKMIDALVDNTELYEVIAYARNEIDMDEKEMEFFELSSKDCEPEDCMLCECSHNCPDCHLDDEDEDGGYYCE